MNSDETPTNTADTITSEMIGLKVKDLSGTVGIIIEGEFAPLVRVAFGQDGKSIWRDSPARFLTIVKKSKYPEGEWYVSLQTPQDKETMLFSKRIRVENLKMSEDRVIANVLGITAEEAEITAKLFVAAPKLLQTLIGIRSQMNHLNEITKAAGTGKSWETELIAIDEVIFDATN